MRLPWKAFSVFAVALVDLQRGCIGKQRLPVGSPGSYVVSIVFQQFANLLGGMLEVMLDFPRDYKTKHFSKSNFLKAI